MRRLTFQSLEPRRVLATLPVGDAMLVNDYTSGVQQLSAQAEAVATLTDGTYVVAFEGRGNADLHGIYLRRFEADGTPAAGSEEAELVNTTYNGEQFAPSVAAFNDGSFVVVWAGRGVGDRYGVFAQWYDANGQKEGDETRLNETVGGRQMDPRVTTDQQGRTIVTWHGVGDGDFDGVYVRVFNNSNANFAPLTDEVLVNSTTNDLKSDSDVVTDGQGGIVVTWSSRHVDGSAATLFTRQFAANGTADGAETAVNSVTGAVQTNASITRLTTGELVVAWSDRSSGADHWNVMARRLNQDGQPMGDAFQLAETTAGQQVSVKVVPTPPGGFLVVWMSNPGDGSGYAISAREFDALGDPVADEFMVDAATAGNQHAPSVSVLDRQVVIAWSGTGNDDLRGVFGRRFMIDTTGGPNLAPVLTPIGTQEARRAVEFVLTVSASDPNGDALTFTLDTAVSPSDAVIMATSDTTAEIRWTPGTDDLPSRVFRVIVTDNGDPQLMDVEQFVVNVDPTAGTLP